MPSCWRKFRMKSPTGSTPTAVSKAVFILSLCEPTAMLVGDPPTYAAKLLMSINAAPTSLAYKSMEERPMVRRSKVEAICITYQYFSSTRGCGARFLLAYPCRAAHPARRRSSPHNPCLEALSQRRGNPHLRAPIRRKHHDPPKWVHPSPARATGRQHWVHGL